MKAQILTALVEIFLRTLSSEKAEEILRRFADFLLDFIEDHVLGSASTIDDRLILPVCDLVRRTFNIEDND
uniref:Uncharacterized protein n=1 Tax=viral metagenome TaxID=1070528 RepID=A0A6H1ZSP6_9ZZZZ